MVPEKEIIRQEELDLRSITERFFRSWPLLIAVLVFWGIVGVLFQVMFPVWHNTVTKIQVEKPKGVNDPGTMVSSIPLFVRPDDSYNVNLKVLLTSYPIVKEAVERTGMQLQYVKEGVVLDKDIYGRSPIRVELDSSYMTFEDHLTPFGTPFYIKFKSTDYYEIYADGEYPITENEFEFEGEFIFGEWVIFDQLKFRVFRNDTLSNSKITLYNDLNEDAFGFILKRSHILAVQYTEDISVEAADVEATVYNVSILAESPDKQTDFFNNLSDIVIARHMSIKTEALDNALDYLTQEVSRVEKLLMLSEDTIQKFKSERGITNFGREGDLVVEQSANLENQKVDLLVRKKYFKYLKEYLKNTDSYGGLISPQAFGVKDQLINDLTSELVDLQYEKNSLAQRSDSENPMLLQLEDKIQSDKDIIIRSISGFETSNQMMIVNINGELKKLETESQTLPQEERDLIRLDRMFRLNEKLYSTLVEKKSEAELARISTSSDIKVIAAPYRSSIEPVLPNPIITVIAIILLSIIFGILAVVFRNLFNDKIEDTKDVRRFGQGLPLIGEFQNSHILLPTHLTAFPDSKASEDLSSILFNATRKIEGLPQVVGVSAYNYKAGASTLAALLATRAGLMGRTVAILDFDFSKPSLNKRFDIRNDDGISDVINGRLDLTEVEHESGYGKVVAIPTGSISKGLLTEKRSLKSIFDELLTKYDLVIALTAPFGVSSQALEIQRLCSLNLVIVRRHNTSHTELETIGEMQLSGTISNVGLVATDTFPSGFKFLARRNGKIYNDPRIGFIGHLRLLLRRI